MPNEVVKKADEKLKEAESKTPPTATKNQLIKSALTAGIAEAAADKLADQLEKDGFEIQRVSTSPQLRVQPAKS